jgi:transcriptional regulator with XRE-family HTH domain
MNESADARGVAEPLGTRLRRVRLARELTQQQVAQQLGTTQQAVTRWERGAAPASTHFSAIADFLNVTVDEVASMVVNANRASITVLRGEAADANTASVDQARVIEAVSRRMAEGDVTAEVVELARLLLHAVGLPVPQAGFLE